MHDNFSLKSRRYDRLLQCHHVNGFIKSHASVIAHHTLKLQKKQYRDVSLFSLLVARPNSHDSLKYVVDKYVFETHGCRSGENEGVAVHAAGDSELIVNLSNGFYSAAGELGEGF